MYLRAIFLLLSVAVSETMPKETELYPVDISEDQLDTLDKDLLCALLKDQTKSCGKTDQENIIWATDNYKNHGEQFDFMKPVTVECITGNYGKVIRPRALKSREQQQQRSREMAEVFTPSWICNKQNNLVDEAWFGRANVFNTETDNPDGSHDWQPSKGKVKFPKDKTWRDYVSDIRLEITCGEAPYLVSRYDTVTGEFIPVEKRIGLLDRKLRVVSENTEMQKEWLDAAKDALKSSYGYEWQGDSLVLARESVLYTFLEHHQAKFNKKVPKQLLKELVDIITWNIWQMDGLKGVVPQSCVPMIDLFGGTTDCPGCGSGNIHLHNGTYACIRDWKTDEKIKFIDLIK